MSKTWHYSTPNKRHKAPFRPTLRSSAGVYLVELLVAITLGTMILFTLTSMLGTTLRMGATTQNELYAKEILADLMEFSRGAGYGFFEDKKGLHTLLTNKLVPSEIGPAVRTSPVQLDCVDREWSASAKAARFRGVVTFLVEDGPELNTLKITIKVAWSDGTSFNAPTDGESAREISKSTILAKDGIDKYRTSEP